ncbi:MAG: P1 family peptidase, partial [Gaiellaceae bacterium]
PAELPAFAGFSRLNGNGEVTGMQWMRESGLLTTPIALTNTHSVGSVHEALVAAALEGDRSMWSLPVVGETWDGVLNDVNGFHVRPEHARAALESASDGPVAEGNVGGGTGMICHGFKGGIGTSSRLADAYAVGVLVQANHGTRARLTIDGVPVGRMIDADRVPLPPRPAMGEGAGSIVVVVATDAPLLPHQCERLAVRAMLGVARVGGAGETSSGDFALAFATGPTHSVEPVPNEDMNPLFYAAIDATEEAIVNALLAAETMTGRGGATVYSLEPRLLADVMDGYGRSSTAVRADA